MKKAFLFVCVMFIAFVVSAQPDITTFLGIPIDGTKKEMIAKLQEKGFEYNQKGDYLTGQFNGRDVVISVVTNNNKVYRIFIQDAYSVSESDIKIRFNNLCDQFLNNKKYQCSVPDGWKIPDSDDISDRISYQMNVNKKRFQAEFYQYPYDWQSYLTDWLAKRYTLEQIAEFNENQDKLVEAALILMEEAKKRSVWFMISKDDYGYDKYKILMFYDNKLNESNGDDL